ncbi:MAG: DUF2238 domain-containing protein [Desulfovibrionaceae bacterium]|nr:DUF2238 domain-containing protein [Desulfovibrionaceae bacterium]
MARFNPGQRWALVLAAVFAAVWAALAIEPWYFEDWALENVLVGVVFVYLWATFRSRPLSRLSYVLVFVFLCLHCVGAHYTYAQVPYDRWSEALFGRSLNAVLGFERNHFDRLAHFLFGLLLYLPARETLLRSGGLAGFRGHLFPALLLMSMSMSFEIIEWWAAVIFGGDLGQAYLGTQGDVWDGQKDMALAALGAVLAMSGAVLAAGLSRRPKRPGPRR